MGEERPEKRQRLTHDDWESKVLGSGDYTKVLPHNEVPFVNRHGELFDLFYVNAAVILKLLDCRCARTMTSMIGGHAAWR